MQQHCFATEFFFMVSMISLNYEPNKELHKPWTEETHYKVVIKYREIKVSYLNQPL